MSLPQRRRSSGSGESETKNELPPPPKTGGSAAKMCPLKPVVDVRKTQRAHKVTKALRRPQLKMFIPTINYRSGELSLQKAHSLSGATGREYLMFRLHPLASPPPSSHHSKPCALYAFACCSSLAALRPTALHPTRCVTKGQERAQKPLNTKKGQGDSGCTQPTARNRNVAPLAADASASSSPAVRRPAPLQICLSCLVRHRT